MFWEERPFQGRVLDANLTSAFRPSGATGAEAQWPMATQRGAKAPLFHDSIAMLFGAEEAAFPGPRSQPEQG